jgi:hypothetical protein
MRKKLVQSSQAQSARFIETAKAIGADETGARFERALKRIVKAKKPKPKQKKAKRG